MLKLLLKPAAARRRAWEVGVCSRLDGWIHFVFGRSGIQRTFVAIDRRMEISPFDPNDAPGWNRARENRLFDHQYIQIDEIDYETPNRDTAVRWTIARRKAGVCVAPQLEDGRFLMIQQERYPIQRVLWEFPAGQIDAPDWRNSPETIVDTAIRELEEEPAINSPAEPSRRWAITSVRRGLPTNTCIFSSPIRLRRPEMAFSSILARILLN